MAMKSVALAAAFVGGAAALATINPIKPTSTICGIVCVDGRNECGQKYGGCYDPCFEPAPTAPPCPTPYLSTFYPTPVPTTTTPGEVLDCRSITICIDAINDCGIPFGGCIPDCKPWNLVTPPCPLDEIGSPVTPFPGNPALETPPAIDGPISILIPTEDNPILLAPTLESPALVTPTLESPSPTPTTPAVESPTLETPTPVTPALESPTSVTPTSESPALVTPILESPTPTTPAMESPALVTPTSETPTPVTPALESPTPVTPTSEPPVTIQEIPIVQGPVGEAAAALVGAAEDGPVPWIPEADWWF